MKLFISKAKFSLFFILEVGYTESLSEDNGGGAGRDKSQSVNICKHLLCARYCSRFC